MFDCNVRESFLLTDARCTSGSEKMSNGGFWHLLTPVYQTYEIKFDVTTGLSPNVKTPSILLDVCHFYNIQNM